MAVKRKNQENTQTQENTNKERKDVVESLEVTRAKDFGKFISFDMIVNGITIYGCIYKTYTDKSTGEEKGMVSFPSRKGSDGKWYSYAYFWITDGVLEHIERSIEEKLG